MTTNELYAENISISRVSPYIYYPVYYYYRLLRHKGRIKHKNNKTYTQTKYKYSLYTTCE